MTESQPPILIQAREEFDELVKDIRPQLHRYCARMVGSIVDAEDVVQEALAKAYYALPITSVSNLQGWLFRIAHNKALDHLRRQDHQLVQLLDDYPIVAEDNPPLEDQEIATMALTLFLQLAPMQRSCVILKDVMGYSLAEMSELLDASIPSIKAALHRGRTRLRELSEIAETQATPTLKEPEASLLAQYVDRFNARDFDAIRTMLADDVRLDLIGRAKWQGATEVGGYYHRYSQKEDWYFQLGWIEGQPAILVYSPEAFSPEAVSPDSSPSQPPNYFILLEWAEGQVRLIRDFRYARYVLANATT